MSTARREGGAVDHQSYKEEQRECFYVFASVCTGMWDVYVCAHVYVLVVPSGCTFKAAHAFLALVMHRRRIVTIKNGNK